MCGGGTLPRRIFYTQNPLLDDGVLNRRRVMTTRLAYLALIFVSATALAQETLPFRRAIELALAHSTEMALTQADESRAYNSYREARNAYIPKAVLGSDLGYAYFYGSRPSDARQAYRESLATKFRLGTLLAYSKTLVPRAFIANYRQSTQRPQR